jgi:hypothetical protein
MRLIRSLVLILLLALLVVSTVGNAPAPYWACDGKEEGDPCKPYGGGGCGLTGGDNVCRLEVPCTDYPGTSVNECLYCD